MSNVPKTKNNIEILEFLKTCSERERHIFCLGMTYDNNIYEMCIKATPEQVMEIVANLKKLDA